MHVLCAVYLSGPLDFGVRLAGFRDELVQLFLIGGALLDRLDNNAMDGATGQFRERAQAGTELRWQADGGSSGHGGNDFDFG